MLLSIKGNFRRVNQREPFWRAVRQGAMFVWSTIQIRRLLGLSLLIEAFGFSHFVMMPVMARDVLGLDATGLGFLSASSGVGSTLGTLAVAGLGDFQKKGILLTGTALGSGVFLVMFALSPWFALSMVLVAIVGGCLMAYDVTMGTMLQLLSGDEMRGRVLGIYGLTFGFTPVGGFFVGSVATVLSAPIAVSLGGILVVVYVTWITRSVSAISVVQETNASN